MVEIAPFKAIRFNPSKTSHLSAVICPPYDIISVPDYHKLLERDPRNIVRVELPLAQGKEDRYALSAQHWTRWQNQRILAQDKEPAFYGYEQRFSVGSQAYFRRGFFAAMRLEKPGHGNIRPHERTFPKHKEDRLLLMRATHANISPIFGIFFDKKNEAATLIQKEMHAKPLVVARDDKGVTHRLWRWTNPAITKALSNVLKTDEVLIADGHHRYETAWNYAQERVAKNRSPARRAAYRYVMTFLCPLSDPGLVIQPTHRSVRWTAPWEEWQKRVESDFSIQRITGLPTLLSRLRNGREPAALGMVMQGGKLFWLKPKNPQGLPVIPLHERLMKDIPLENVTYAQDPRAMVESIQRNEAQVVFLLPPPDKGAFAQICKSGQLLPQKSTYFYPKVTTGLVMRSLDGDL